jgi:hypothetical protein
MRRHQLQHRAEVTQIIGREPELGSALHGARELVQRARRDHAPLVMPRLGPGVREQDEHPAEASVRQRRQQEPRVVDEDADVAEIAAAHLGQEFDHAVLEHLGAEETHVGVRRGLLGQMLTGAEADLEPDLGERNGKEPLRVNPPVFRQIDGELRQEAREQVALARPQLAAAAPAIEDSAP